MTTTVTTNSDDSFSFSTARNFDQALAMAKVISSSDLVPKDYKGKPENVLVAIEMGKDLGLNPMQAIQNIAVINGRPSLWGDAMLAIVQGHSEFEYVDETIENGVATCSIKRKGKPIVVRSFSEEDAKTAKLLNKDGPWTQYRKRMLQLRARSFALRDAFADALKGIHMAEEVRDYAEQDNVKISNARKAYAALAPTLKTEYKPEFSSPPKMESIISDTFIDGHSITCVAPGVDIPFDSKIHTFDHKTGEFIITTPPLVSNVDSIDGGKSVDIQRLERIVIDNNIPADIVHAWYTKAGVDSITDLKHETIKALIKKHGDNQ